MKPRTLFEKIWSSHVVHTIDASTAVLFIDLHLLHEVTSPQAFARLRADGLSVRRRARTFATVDHNVSTTDQTVITDPLSRLQVTTLVSNCKRFGIPLFGLDSPHQGIVHIIGPELGLTHPGMTVVCGDSHTSTHGAFGAFAFGIGTTEIAHVLATQCLIQKKMKTMEVRIDGTIGKGVTAKDVALSVLSRIGTKGGVGYCIEYTGSAVRRMNMDERMTLCNMSIEGGARAGMIAPDETTFQYVSERLYAPKGDAFFRSLAYWKTLWSDEGASYDSQVLLDGSQIEPLVTYGTDPSTGIRVHDAIPNPKFSETEDQRQTLENALAYMGLKPGMTLEGFPIDYVFIGSCTNARLFDLRVAASFVRGRHVNRRVTAFVVPGSRQTKVQAETEGLDRIFTDAGFQWRWSGCSACIAMNEDKIPTGSYCVSTSNRNYEGRQGPGARTFLASPIMAAAAACMGKIVDVRHFL